jgi:hypothetical protein
VCGGVAIMSVKKPNSSVPKLTKQFELEDTPDIISKLLGVVDREADRILSAPAPTASDIRMALQCISVLTNLHKVNQQAAHAANLQLSNLSPTQLLIVSQPQPPPAQPLPPVDWSSITAQYKANK